MSTGLTRLDEESLVRASNLEETLLALSKYGKPRLCHDGDGWYACIKMHVAAKGVEFDISSDFRRATPQAAISQLVERLVSTLNSLTKQ